MKLSYNPATKIATVSGYCPTQKQVVIHEQSPNYLELSLKWGLIAHPVQPVDPFLQSDEA